MSINKDKTAVLVLHDIRSVHNVGAIFRSADAAGVAKIFLAGYTPGPLDRFLRPRADFEKAALGARVEWERVADALTLVRRLKEEGYVIVALEQDPRAVDYKKVNTAERFALVLGNETEGLSREVLDACDVVAEIPMRGAKESLNVSVAAGIALFRLLNR